MNGFERHPYIPNSVPEVQQEMLQELGMSSLEELHKNVPELLKLKKEMDLPPAFESEYACAAMWRVCWARIPAARRT